MFLFGLPIIAAVQLNREDVENGPSTRNIAESDRIGQDATTVLFIERAKITKAQEEENTNEKMVHIVITVGKARNAITGSKLNYMWDINKGELNYINSKKDALNGKEPELSRECYNDSGSGSNDVF